MGKFFAFSAREFLPFFGLGDSFDRRGCVDFQAFAWGSAYSFRLQGFSGLGSWNFRAENTEHSLFLFKYKSNLKYLMIWFSKFGLNISLTSTILAMIFSNFAIFWYRPDSQQVKRNLMSSITNLVCEFPHEMPNDLKFRNLGDQETLVECVE